MCDQREQLIGYLYDECTPDERRAVEAHLGECHVCRAEVGGLRDVRQDLLAWDVPAHESVWRPFVAPRVTNPWRAMPAWAMAAAATLVFVAGAAGGAASRLLWPASAFGQVATATPAPVVLTPASVTVGQQDLNNLKLAILTQVRAEMDQRVMALAASHDRTTKTAADGVSQAALRDVATRLTAFENWQRKQIAFSMSLDNKVAGIVSRYSAMNASLAANRQVLQPASYGFEAR
ncbi:MAG: zf-HC2 domain-containing protein [Acidobacteriota bacterium]